jgi:hypothetical protein
VDEKEPRPDRKRQDDASSSIQMKEKTAGHSAAINPALATLAARRKPNPDLSSSIASNLATARGKPPSQRRSTPLPPNVTAQHAGGKLISRGVERASTTQRPSNSRQPSTTPAPAQPAATDTFSTFYNSLQGLYSRLPASLAFTGLPLTVEEETESQATSSKAEDPKNHKRQGSSRATADPDYASMFSSSTIKALQQDAQGTFAGHESFYVVPTSGGTRSYAGIVSGREEDALLAGDDDGDEFQDARETIGPPSPRSTRSSGTLRKGKKAEIPRAPGGKTLEELELENNALRQLLDTQSHRIQMWETSAQDRTMLAQSMRFGTRDTSRDRASIATTESDRVKELDEELSAERAQREALEHQNEKMQREKEKLLAALGKYKDKWAMLKENARQRERNKQAKLAGEQDPQ